MRLLKVLAPFLMVFVITLPAKASPGFDFVCYNEGFSASIGLDLEWSTAYMNVDGATTELKSGDNAPTDGSFSFDDANFNFRGFPPTGQLRHVNGMIADCFQTAESLSAMALYGAETNGKWPRFMASGQGFQTVRSAPSPLAEKMASLDQRTPVTIIENTGQFLDGFYWFKITFDQGKQGYMWGALLCSNVDEPVLNTVVKKCS